MEFFQIKNNDNQVNLDEKKGFLDSDFSSANSFPKDLREGLIHENILPTNMCTNKSEVGEVLHSNSYSEILLSNLENEGKYDLLNPGNVSASTLFTDLEKEEVNLNSQNSSQKNLFSTLENKMREIDSVFDNSLAANFFTNLEAGVDEMTYAVNSTDSNVFSNPDKISGDTTNHDISTNIDFLSQLINCKQQCDTFNKTVPFDSSLTKDKPICDLTANINESVPSLPDKALSEENDNQVLNSMVIESTKENSNSKFLESVVCKKIYAAQVSLKRLEICHDRVFYVCKICNKFWKTKPGLCQHMLRHEDEPQFKQSKSYHPNKGFYICKVCDKLWNTKSQLQRHILSHSAKQSFSCNICNKTFKTLSNLKLHLHTHLDERPYQCKFCDKSFKTRRNLAGHKAIHSMKNLFVCKVCDKSFKTKIELIQHLKSHSDKRPFVCDICKKSCKSKGNLKLHMFSHSSEKPFLCEICGKTFKTKHELNQHFTYHSEEGKQNSKIAKTNPNLDQQIDFLTEERVFICLICEKGCKTIRSLNVHMLSHSEKSFVCETCSKSFKTKPELKQHLISHSDVRPFVCDICNKSCKSKGNLKAHILIHNDK